MNISGPFGEVDKVGCYQSGKIPIDSIEKIVSRDIIRRLYPLPLEHSPKSLGNVEMRGIRRQEEKVKSPFLPYFSHFLHILASVYFGVVKHDECVLPYCKGEPANEILYAFGCHAFGGTEAMIPAVVVNHSPDIESCATGRWNGDVLTGKLPAVWHISFGTSEASVSKIEVNKAFTILTSKLLPLLLLISVELRRGCSIDRFPYMSKSCAKADKKALYVSRHASLLVACCHLSLAFITLSLSFSIASLTASSFDESIMGLAPCPGLFRRPSTPCSKYRFTHWTTLCSEHNSFFAISFDGRPSALSYIIRLRFCINGLESKCSMYSNSTRCLLVSFTSVIRQLAETVPTKHLPEDIQLEFKRSLGIGYIHALNCQFNDIPEIIDNAHKYLKDRYREYSLWLFLSSGFPAVMVAFATGLLMYLKDYFNLSEGTKKEPIHL